jgi:hypothetical protein
MKKSFSAFLILSIFLIFTLSLNTFTFASELISSNTSIKNINDNKNAKASENVKWSGDDTYLLGSKFFNVNKPQDGIVLYSEDPGDGTIRIDDVLSSEAGWVTATDKSYTSYDSVKYVSIKIISSIPVIGNLYNTISSIYDGLKAVCNDLTSMVGTKSGEVITKYTYRGFSHDLYAYNEANRVWKNVGYSLSRYYYKSSSMWYYNQNIGEYRWASYNFSKDNGYGPAALAKAPHYMDYTYLSNAASNAYYSGHNFYETY